MSDPDYFWSCANCGIRSSMPKSFNAWLREDARRKFYCVKGHSNVYSNSDNDIDKIRRERDRLKQSKAHQDDLVSSLSEQRKSAERKAAAAKGQVTKLKKRAAAGVCPCCNRTFANLQNHMKGQHPEFLAEEVSE